MILDIGLTVLLVLLNGFFVAAEFAIVKVRSSQIELRIRAGSRLAKLAKNLIYHLDEYLSATQLGITLASLGLGWIGESVVSRIIFDTMQFAGISITYELAHQIALPTAFASITMLHIVFGELIPKSLAIQRAESVTLAIAVPLRMFYLLFKPFIWLLNSFANKFIKIIGFEPVTEEETSHSTEELRYLLEESSKRGVIDSEDHALLENIFEFSSTPVKQIMVPRGKIVGVELSMTREQIVDKFIVEGYSRMPVYDKNIDNIMGIIYTKNLIDLLSHPNLFIIQDMIRPPYFVGEEEKIDKVFRYMQRNRIHIAIVIDEFGGTAGLATLEDIVEEIFGEIQDEDDEEKPIVLSMGDNQYIVDPSAIVGDANDFLPEPLQESDDYETIGGLIINEIGRIPEPGEIIEIANYSIEILNSSNIHIESIKMTYAPADTEVEE